MGVYIKDLDMPTSCEECLGYREDAWYGASCLFLQDEDGWAVEIDDGVTDEYDLEQERHPNCPLVDIKTPHGRLIDADALDKELRRKWNYGDNGVTIENAATILEAEE